MLRTKGGEQYQFAYAIPPRNTIPNKGIRYRIGVKILNILQGGFTHEEDDEMI